MEELNRGEEIDLVEALSKLLTDHSLRQSFYESPADLADRLNLKSESKASFLDLDHAQLESQARILIGKRWHEVCRLLPKTIKALGEQGREAFDFFANQYWPTGHQRHFLDALEFCEFVESNDLGKCNRQETKRLQLRLRKQESVSHTGKHPH